MKKFILFALVSLLMLGCTAQNSKSMPTQYKAIALYEDTDTTTILYTFKDNIMYIDEVGNEGFAYPYMVERHCLYFYDEVWDNWYRYEFVRRPNGDIVIKCKEGDILLQKQKNFIDLGFD